MRSGWMLPTMLTGKRPMWRGRLRDFRLMVTLAAAHASRYWGPVTAIGIATEIAKPGRQFVTPEHNAAGVAADDVHQGLNRGVCDNDLARHEVIVEGRFHGLQRDRRSSLERCVAFAFPFVLEQPGLLDLGIVLQLPLFVSSAPVPVRSAR